METMIQRNELTKVFKTDEVETWALDKVNIEIGQIGRVVMGPFGLRQVPRCSTFLRPVGQPVFGGQYLLRRERRVSSCSESKRNRNCAKGFVFQSFNLINRADGFLEHCPPLFYMVCRSRGTPTQGRGQPWPVWTSCTVHAIIPRQISGGQQHSARPSPVPS